MLITTSLLHLCKGRILPISATMLTLNVLTTRFHDLSEFKPTIFLFCSLSSCHLLPFIGKMILRSSQCLPILQAFIGKYFYLPYSSYAKVWGCFVRLHIPLVAHSKLLSVCQGLFLTSVICHDLCTCNPTLRWFLCCHASAIKKKLLNESNREEQWAITGCSRRGHYSIFSCAILL